MTDLGDLLETNPSLRWLGEPVLGLFYLQLGQDHLAAGNYPLAWAEFEQAATLRPRDAEAAFNAGLLSLTLGRGVQAMEWYTEGIARATLDGEILPLLQPAIDDLSALLDTNPRLKWLCAPILKTMQTAAGADSDSK